MSEASPPIWITEADVKDLVGWDDAIEAVAGVQQAIADGQTINMRKTVAMLSHDAQLHALGGELLTEGVSGTKTWTYTPNGAQPLVILYSVHDGHVLAVIEAFALGQFRTGSTAALATRHLAAPDADELAMFGTGKQSLAQIAAVNAVRPLKLVRLHGRNEERLARVAGRVEDELGISCKTFTSAAEATDGAPIITIATRATSPIVTSDMVAPGAHVNGMGAATPERQEFEPKLLARCDYVVADVVEQARALGSELREFYGYEDTPEVDAAWQAVRPLSEMVAAGVTRPADADVTLLKSVGLGLSDVGMGLMAFRRAAEAGRGYPLPVYASH